MIFLVLETYIQYWCAGNCYLIYVNWEKYYEYWVILVTDDGVQQIGWYQCSVIWSFYNMLIFACSFYYVCMRVIISSVLHISWPLCIKWRANWDSISGIFEIKIKPKLKMQQRWLSVWIILSGETNMWERKQFNNI